jgi:hypothetical protein
LINILTNPFVNTKITGYVFFLLAVALRYSLEVPNWNDKLRLSQKLDCIPAIGLAVLNGHSFAVKQRASVLELAPQKLRLA